MQDFTPGDQVELLAGRRAYATNRAVRSYTAGARFTVADPKAADIANGNKPIGDGATVCQEHTVSACLVVLPTAQLKLVQRK